MVVQEGVAGEIIFILISLVFRSFQRPALPATGSDNFIFQKWLQEHKDSMRISEKSRAFPAFEDRVDEN